MEQYLYTKREVQMIRSLHPLAITDEEFLSLYNKAYHRNHIQHINHLGNVYPEIEARVFSDDFENQHTDPADHEGDYLFPILCPTNRCTEGRIKDMVCYLTGEAGWTNAMQKQLYETIPHRLVFNYLLDKYVKDYNAGALWDSFFLGLEKLSHVLILRKITGLDELAYRAMEYYDRYLELSCAECGMGDRKGATYGSARGEKPHRKVCSKNGVKRIFSGLGVPTSGLEFL